MFTTREQDALSLIRQGKSNKQIAYELKLSESTVKVHVRNIMAKLKAHNRTQVVYLTQNFPYRQLSNEAGYENDNQQTNMADS
jgi:DNA-binding NarL/FixJ family response regulator